MKSDFDSLLREEKAMKFVVTMPKLPEAELKKG